MLSGSGQLSSVGVELHSCLLCVVRRRLATKVTHSHSISAVRRHKLPDADWLGLLQYTVLSGELSSRRVGIVGRVGLLGRVGLVAPE